MSDFHSRYYNMEGKKITREQAYELWGGDQEETRRVAVDHLPHPGGGKDILVSTVLLVLDHQFDNGPPLIFETMIFGGEHDEGQWRYSTREQAEAGHAEAVKLVKGEK